MKRTVSVEAMASFEFEIDDEAVSEWDGAKILEVIKHRGVDNDIYSAGATIDDLLAFLGIQLCVEGRTMGNFDGWADFPESAANGSPFSVTWDVERVRVSK